MNRTTILIIVIIGASIAVMIEPDANLVAYEVVFGAAWSLALHAWSQS